MKLFLYFLSWDNFIYGYGYWRLSAKKFSNRFINLKARCFKQRGFPPPLSPLDPQAQSSISLGVIIILTIENLCKQGLFLCIFVAIRRFFVSREIVFKSLLVTYQKTYKWKLTGLKWAIHCLPRKTNTFFKKLFFCFQSR